MTRFIDILTTPIEYNPGARDSLGDWMVGGNKVSEESFLQRLETDFLNPLGHVPVVGTLTGSLRLLLSVCDLFMALILWPICAFLAFNLDMIAYSLVFFLNFIANLLRGSLEIIPFGGKAVEYFWDATKMRMPCW